MVIIFKSERARKYLLKNGFVFTIRTKKRKTGKDWMTHKRRGKKICDVIVELWREIPTEVAFPYLNNYVNRSGYLTVSDWLDEVLKLNNLKELPATIYLYRVMKM